MRKTVKCTTRRIVTSILAIMCVFVVCTVFVGCQSNDSDTNYNYSSYDYSLTESKAISIAKESSEVENEIASKYGMKFFYTPDWGTVTATEDSSGDWKVVLKGTISGYTDDYKTDFEYDKKFTATVTVSSSGYVVSVSVSKY